MFREALPALRRVLSADQSDTENKLAKLAYKREYLREIDIFRDLADPDLMWLEQRTRMSTVPKGQMIYRHEDAAEELFLLKRGRVRLSRLTPTGKKLDIATLEPSTFFGEMPLVGEQLRNAYAEAVEECVICIMSREDIELLVLRKPQVALRLLEVMGQRLSDTESRLEDMAYRNVPTRLASVLLRLCRNGSDVIEITHEELSEMVGAYRVTITKTLNEFESAGYIELARRRIRVLDRSQLAALLLDA